MSRSNKVFIVYPHNPHPYVWTPPTPEDELRRQYPEKNDGEISQMRVQEAIVIENEVKRQINCHNQLVDSFAKFLVKHGLDVAYEGLLQDKSTASYMRWFQEELKTSDFIVLIITDSFHHFLSNPLTFPHNGEEQIFEGNFLHNLVHRPTKPLLPVFLGDSKNLDLLPDALRSSSTYQVRTTPNFSLEESEMDSLYAVLTEQNRCELPPPGPKVVLLKGRRRFGPGKLQQQQQQNLLMGSEVHRQMYDSLRACSRQITSESSLKLAEKDDFAKHWKKLTRPLCFSDADVARIEADNPEEESERCYNVLLCWAEKEPGAATVSKLASIVWTHCQDAAMLEVTHSVLLDVN